MKSLLNKANISFAGSVPFEVLRMAFSSIFSHKFRSTLTVLGIVVGILTAIVVASILTGMRQNIAKMFEEYGSDNIYLFHLSTGFGPSNRDERNRRPLTVEDAKAILTQSSAVNDITSVAINIGSWGTGFDDNMIYKDRNYRWALTDGVEPNYLEMMNLRLKAGRWITEMDNRERKKVLVIGVDPLQALFNGNVDEALGAEIRMNGTTWQIIGVLEKRENGFFGENEEDRKIFMPFSTARKEAPTRDALLLVAQAKKGQLSDAMMEIESILRVSRGVKFGSPNDFDIKTADSFMAQFDGMMAGIGAAAIAISCLGLLVGGIGVMNIMLVSVTERTKEIGIRKALGATKRAIVFQFLSEAMTLTFFGGAIGIFLAIAISKILLILLPSLPAKVELWMILLSAGVSLSIGLIFGVLPARKAAKLDPIECLRYE
jgi:putative ABC transport system permease protein